MSAAQARLQKDLGTKCRKIAACMRMRHRAGMREVMQMNTTHEIMPGVTYTIVHRYRSSKLRATISVRCAARSRWRFLVWGDGGILILTPPPAPQPRARSCRVVPLLVLVPRALDLEVGATRSDRARCAARRGWRLPRRRKGSRNLVSREECLRCRHRRRHRRRPRATLASIIARSPRRPPRAAPRYTTLGGSPPAASKAGRATS